MGWREAAFELAAGTVLAGVEWVWTTVQTLRNALLTLSCCLSNCEGIKNIVTHLKRAVRHFLLGSFCCEELAWRFTVLGVCSDVLPLHFRDSAAFSAAFLLPEGGSPGPVDL